MTDNELGARLARIEAAVVHLQTSFDKADIQTVRDRITKLEAKAIDPIEVHNNSINAAVANALRTSATRTVGLAVGISSFIASIVFGVLTLILG